MSYYNPFAKVIQFLVLALFFLPTGAASTIHAVIFASTNDASIGKGNTVSLSLFEEEFSRIEKILPIKRYIYDDDLFTKDNVSYVINKLKPLVKKNDIVLFIFLGHGYNPLTSFLKYPNLLFSNTQGSVTPTELKANSLPLQTIIDDFSVLDPRLFIAFVEACNYDPEEESEEEFSFLNGGAYNIALPPIPDEKKLEELFVKPSGSFIITSSQPKEPSYINDEDGGIFSQALILALKKETSVNNTATTSLDEFFERTKTYTLDLAEKISVVQTPQMFKIPPSDYSLETDDLIDPEEEFDYKNHKKRKFVIWLVALFTKSPVKKDFEKGLSQGKISSLRQSIPPGEKGDRTLNKIYRKTPVMYHIAEALVSELDADTAKAMLNFSIAYELLKAGTFTDKDRKIMKLMEENDTDNITGIKDASQDFNKWLRKKLGLYKDKYQEMIVGFDNDIGKNQKKLQIIDDDIAKLLNDVKDINLEIKELEQKIEKADQPRVRSVQLELDDIQKISGQTWNDIRDVYDKIQEEGLVDSLTDVKEIAVPNSNAKIQMKFGKEKMNSNLQTTPNGYKLGKYCTDEIVEVTENTMLLLLKKIDDIPVGERGAINVDLTITGNADWKGGSGKLNIYYKSEEEIDQEYIDKNNDPHSFYMEVGDSRNINNEELAFLRAYCAFQKTLSILQGKGISPTQIKVKFIAIAHAKPSPMPPGVDPGKKYRGIEISIQIENLYKHYQDKLDELRNELAILQGERQKKMDLIEKKKGEKKAIEEEIKRLEEEKKKTENLIGDINPLKAQSSANKAFEKVDRAFSKK